MQYELLVREHLRLDEILHGPFPVALSHPHQGGGNRPIQISQRERHATLAPPFPKVRKERMDQSMRCILALTCACFLAQRARQRRRPRIQHLHVILTQSEEEPAVSQDTYEFSASGLHVEPAATELEAVLQQQEAHGQQIADYMKALEEREVRLSTKEAEFEQFCAQRARALEAREAAAAADAKVHSCFYEELEEQKQLLAECDQAALEQAAILEKREMEVEESTSKLVTQQQELRKLEQTLLKREVACAEREQEVKQAASRARLEAQASRQMEQTKAKNLYGPGVSSERGEPGVVAGPIAASIWQNVEIGERSGAQRQPGNEISSCTFVDQFQNLQKLVSNVLRFTSHTSCLNMEGVHVLSVHEIVNPARQRLYESAGACVWSRSLEHGPISPLKPPLPVAIGELSAELGARFGNHGRDNLNEAILLHGTSASYIARYGFDCRLSDGLFGQGTYFTCQACKAHDYTEVEDSRGSRVLLVAKVLLGNVEYAKEPCLDYRRPKAVGEKCPGMCYDSVVANIAGMSAARHREFISYDNSTCLPWLLVRYALPQDAADDQNDGF